MRFGRTLPPAAAPIGWKNIFAGLRAVFRGKAELHRFSEELKEYFDKPYCFLVSSGKAAFTLTLVSLKRRYPDRDEVLIPAYTCYSVPAAVSRAGLKVKLCDTNEDNFDFDIDKLKTLLKSKKVLCVVPTHLFGLPADVALLKKAINDPEVTVVEDAAQAMGGEWLGRKLGTQGDVGFFSLGRGKAFSTIEGGIILTDNDALASELKQQISETPGYSFMALAKLCLYAFVMNIMLRPSFFWLPKSLPFLKLGETFYDTDFKVARMSSFQAGLSKNWATTLCRFRAERQKNTRALAVSIDTDLFKLFVDKNKAIPDLIRLPVEIADDQLREETLCASNSQGLGVSVAYPGVVSDIPAMKNMSGPDDYVVARKHSNQLLTFPVHPLLKANDMKAVLELLNCN